MEDGEATTARPHAGHHRTRTREVTHPPQPEIELYPPHPPKISGKKYTVRKNTGKNITKVIQPPRDETSTLSDDRDYALAYDWSILPVGLNIDQSQALLQIMTMTRLRSSGPVWHPATCGDLAWSKLLWKEVIRGHQRKSELLWQEICSLASK